MSIELLPQGVKCNLSCDYCYQDPMRAAGNYNPVPLEFNKIKDKLKSYFTVFGGEALLTPKDKLEEIFAYGLEKFGRNSVQTNGLLIDADHIRMFKQYKVGVGVSIDGWGILNSPRSTVMETQQILQNIQWVQTEQLSTSLIVTIHKANANRGILDFFQWCEDIKIPHINLHILEVDTPKGKALELTNEENFHIFAMMYDWSLLHKIKFNPFEDMKALLTQDKPSVNCTWNACDAVNTDAVQGIRTDGELANCGRTNKDGVDWIKAKSSGRERYLALYNTPFEYGGCKDCKYFYACKGQCPGTAIDGDWRNKTVHCEFWYQLFDYIRQGTIDPFSDQEMLLKGQRFIGNGQVYKVEGNHADTPHGDRPHGDSHGDSHGDHTDIKSLTKSSKGIPVSWKD